MIRRLRAHDGGSIAPMVPILLLALFILGGLVVDGSRELNARGEAQAYADEAARAGATAVDFTSADLALDEAQARARVDDYCAKVMATKGSPVQVCKLDPDHPFTDDTTCKNVTAQIVVNTIVQTKISTTLMGIVGIPDLTATVTAKARPFTGLTRDQAC